MMDDEARPLDGHVIDRGVINGSFFTRLADTTPVPLTKVTGCRWPIYARPTDPLRSPVAEMFCNAPCGWVGDRRLPYCDPHMRMSKPRNGV